MLQLFVDSIKPLVFIEAKIHGTILTMRINVLKSSMRRNHWITDQWWKSLTNARQLIDNVNECQGTWVHLNRDEWMCWSRVTYKIWQSRDIVVFPLFSTRRLAIDVCKFQGTPNNLWSWSQIRCWGRWDNIYWKVGLKESHINQLENRTKNYLKNHNKILKPS